VLSPNLTVKITKSNIYKGAGYPAGTLSQMVKYLDEAGDEVCTVHRYLCPDNSLGASGREDPKALRVRDIRYLAHADKLQAERQLGWRLGWLTLPAQRAYGAYRKLKCWVIGR